MSLFNWNNYNKKKEEKYEVGKTYINPRVEQAKDIVKKSESLENEIRYTEGVLRAIKYAKEHLREVKLTIEIPDPYVDRWQQPIMIKHELPITLQDLKQILEKGECNCTYELAQKRTELREL